MRRNQQCPNIDLLNLSKLRIVNKLIIINYGEVEIQTAAEHGATVYPMIADPKMLKEVVADARDKYAKNLAKSPHGDLISHA